MKKTRNQIIGDCVSLFLLLLPIIYVVRNLALTAFDPDTFFLLATGKNIVESGAVPTINPFVIHEGFEIIVQQWLFDVILYYLHSWFGIYGIYGYCIVTATLSILVISKFIDLFTQNRDVKFLCIALFCVSMQPFFIARPTSISFILCTLLVIIMELYRQKKKWQYLLLLPIISLASVNLHSSMWPILFVLMLPYLAPENLFHSLKSMFSINDIKKKNNTAKFSFREYVNQNKYILLAIIAMIVFGFLNPNGLNGMIYSALSYNSAKIGNLIYELQAPTVTSISGLICIGSILTLVLYCMRFKNNLHVPMVYMTMGTIFLAMSHQRNRWFLFFSILPLIAMMLDTVLNQRTATAKQTQKISKLPMTIFIIIALLVPAFFQPKQIDDGFTAPIAAREYLDTKNKEDIILYTGFNNGAYMEFHGYQVYIDARPELYQSIINKKADIFQEYVDVVHTGKSDIKSFLEKYNFTHLIAEKGQLLEVYLQASNEYKVVVDTESYRLYEKIQ